MMWTHDTLHIPIPYHVYIYGNTGAIICSNPPGIYIFRRKMGGSPKVMRFGIRANAVVTNVHNKPYVTFNGKSLDMVSSLGLPN